MRTRMYRVDEVVDILNVGRSTVYNLIKDGTLPSLKIAGCRRVSDCDLEKYITGCKMQAGDIYTREPAS